MSTSLDEVYCFLAPRLVDINSQLESALQNAGDYSIDAIEILGSYSLEEEATNQFDLRLSLGKADVVLPPDSAIEIAEDEANEHDREELEDPISNEIPEFFELLNSLYDDLEAQIAEANRFNFPFFSTRLMMMIRTPEGSRYCSGIKCEFHRFFGECRKRYYYTRFGRCFKVWLRGRCRFCSQRDF